MFPNSPNISIALLTIINAQDSLGNRRLVLQGSKEVVGVLKSITSQEYQTAVLIQKHFDCKVVLQAFIYGGQKYALVKGKIFKIERTYVNGQFIELYLTETEIKAEELKSEDEPG